MSDNTETAVLAGGCYWTMQQLLRQPDGVISTRVGWTGGEGDDPTEENPQGHAEAVEVLFDPERISYRDLLEYFFQVHRPDLAEHIVGSIYRSEIFCKSEPQRKIAEQMIRDVDASGYWLGKTVTKERGRSVLGGRRRGSGLLPPLSALSGRLQAPLPAPRRGSCRPRDRGLAPERRPRNRRVGGVGRASFVETAWKQQTEPASGDAADVRLAASVYCVLPRRAVSRDRDGPRLVSNQRPLA